MMTDARITLDTGASGFVGRPLCTRLGGRGRVRGLFRGDARGPWDEAFRADLSVEGPLGGALEGVDTIFHLAGRTDDGKTGARGADLFRRVNCDGTARLIEAAAVGGVRRFVYLSSIKAMGAGGDEALDEKSPALPTTPYGRSKKEAEDIVLGCGDIPHVCVLRSTPVYGAGSKGNLGRMIRAMARGLFPPIPDTKNVRSMVHIEDLVEALVLCAEKAEAHGRVFIVTDGKEYSTRQIYDWVCETMGRRAPSWSVPPALFHAAAKVGDALGGLARRPVLFDSGTVERLLGSARYDSTLIERTLGFEPGWDLKRALPEMVMHAR
jgi:nucleoside-diphosphate-sugar epimerase